MSAFELNKVIGAVLAALVFVMGLSVLSDIIFSEEELYDPAYRIEIAETAAGEGAPVEEEVPFAVLLASADPAAGEANVRVCSACHAWEEGGANGIGPGLYNVVGKTIGSHAGFNYSGVLSGMGAEGKVWDWDALNGFLESPSGWAPGTIMGYAGIRDDKERADVIAYLASISPDAPPLPDPPAQEEVAAVAPDTATDATTPAEAAATEAEAKVEESAALADADPFTRLVASADPAAGQANAVVCQACHNYEEGAGHKLGPNLYNVFGPIASKEGFSYSAAMTAYAEEVGAWDVATLNEYLEAPMEVVPGTTMAYAGVKDEEERAQIVAWLHSVSPDAGPIIPEVPAAEQAEEQTAAVDAEAAPAAEPAPAQAAAPAETAPAAEAAPATEAAPAETTPATPAAAAPSEGAPAAPAAEAMETTQESAAEAPAADTAAAPAFTPGVQIQPTVEGSVTINKPSAQ